MRVETKGLVVKLDFLGCIGGADTALEPLLGHKLLLGDLRGGAGDALIVGDLGCGLRWRVEDSLMGNVEELVAETGHGLEKVFGRNAKARCSA